MHNKMHNIDHRIIIALLVFIAFFHTACSIENPNETYYDGKLGDFEWHFYNGEMVISKYRGPGGDVTIPPQIDGKPVKVIGNSAFNNCTGLTGITIPESVTSIWPSAFAGCIGLTSVCVPDGVINIRYNAFRDCDNLESVILPNSVTAIESGAFYGCVSLI